MPPEFHSWEENQESSLTLFSRTLNGLLFSSLGDCRVIVNPKRVSITASANCMLKVGTHYCLLIRSKSWFRLIMCTCNGTFYMHTLNGFQQGIYIMYLKRILRSIIIIIMHYGESLMMMMKIKGKIKPVIRFNLF